MSRVALLSVISVFASFFGCRTETSPPVIAPNAAAAPPLRLLVIGDPELAKTVKRQWEARAAAEMTLRELSEIEFGKTEQKRLAADVVIYPAALLGELAARDWLAPLAEADLDQPSFELRDIFEQTRRTECSWGEKTVAVPLGSPTWVLVYRRDELEKLGLKPPRDWAEYRKLVEQLPTGTCEPRGEGFAAELLLARAAAYAKHRSQYSALFEYASMKPLIDGPPFVRALEELVEAARLSPKDAAHLSPSHAARKVLDGHCAMAIGWPTVFDGPTPQWAAEIGFAPLPGSRDVFNIRAANWDQRGDDESPHVPFVGSAGRLGSVTKESRQPLAAANLLFWLAGPEMSVSASTASRATGPFRKGHVAQAGKWLGESWPAAAARKYGEAVEQSLGETTGFSALRIPGHERYLASLSLAVRDAADGKVKPSDALAKVARHWDELTNELGHEKQRSAYMQSIGLAP